MLERKSSGVYTSGGRDDPRPMMSLRLPGLVSLALLLWPSLAAAAPAQPNVIIVLTDDQGYGDLSCHGNPTLKTPNLDRLHDQSVRLTDFHVSPMCTPTRSQLMTGRDALDNGGMNVSSGRSMIRRGIPTMAEVFANSGYRTALFGKWHLGDVYPYRPQDRGFHSALWFPSSHIPSAPDAWNNDYFNTTYRTQSGELTKLPGYCTDVQFDQAMQWMEQTTAAKQPFFTYLALNSAHWPWWVPDEYREPYRALDKDLASFFGMIANIDRNMGRLDEMLARTGLRENTLLIFMTDNGGTVGVKHFNAGMKGGKVTLWDGGHRVPMFVRWPAGGVGEARDVDELTQVQDVLPTLIDLCGLDTPREPEFDGITLAPLLRGTQSTLADRMLVIQFSRMNDATPDKFDSAVLWKKWRLIKGLELYNVSTDLTQERNVAKVHPDVVAKMRAHYETWWADVEPRVNVLSRLPIGNDGEPTTLLSAADWQDLLLDQQLQIRTALPRNSHWNLEVVRDGDYTFELRRWPREADLSLRAGAPTFKGVDGGLPEGKPLPIARARLKVGDVELSAPVAADEKSVRFTLPLKKGDVQAQTWFYDDAGAELCGAYYVYVSLAPRPSP
jgi:arylsulfatase A-like enzyme